MKKSFFILSLVVVNFAAIAQTSKGKMMIGGNGNFANSSAPGSTVSQGYITPSFGYFVKDRLAIGLLVNYSYSAQPGTPTTTSWAYAPYVRYYKYTANDKFAFYAQASLGYTPASNGGQDSYTFVLHPGFVYFFTEHWGLDLELNGLELGTGGHVTEFNLSSILSPAIGFRYYFGK